jgi:hypothetical protein
MPTRASALLGASLIIAMFGLGYLLGNSIITFKSFERTVNVKGLAEQEVNADMVLWPIQYLYADNDLTQIYTKLEHDTQTIQAFLLKRGFDASEMSFTAPAVTDKLAQNYGDGERIPFRYSAVQTLTLYTSNVDAAREAMTAISALGKSGIVFRTDTYENKTEFLFTKLNEIKPKMIEEATQNARKAAIKFAEDSDSKLGKIKYANQGQFSVTPRDAFTPHIKKVRVVSTVEYYLDD